MDQFLVAPLPSQVLTSFVIERGQDFITVSSGMLMMMASSSIFFLSQTVLQSPTCPTVEMVPHVDDCSHLPIRGSLLIVTMSLWFCTTLLLDQRQGKAFKFFFHIYCIPLFFYILPLLTMSKKGRRMKSLSSLEKFWLSTIC